MANLRLAMDSAFWDLNLSTPQTLDGTARAVPGEGIPLNVARASRAIRPQQLSLLGNGFPLGLIPSYCPTSSKELGSFALQSLLFRPTIANWWMGIIGQIRPRKLISSIKSEVYGGDEIELPAFKDVVKHVLDKSLYSLGLCSQIAVTKSASLFCHVEKDGEKKGHRSKAMFYYSLPHHDVTLEAAWPELFVDKNGGYWDVPSSLSLDLTSLVSESGLRYHVGIHKNGADPQPFNATSGEPPVSLMPGIFTKAAFSYEKKMDLWRDKEKRINPRIRKPKQQYEPPSYDVRLSEPHAALSGIIGGACSACFGGNEAGSIAKKMSQFNADFFGSACYAYQHGKFRNDFLDLTRVDVRLDICSASAFLKGATQLISNAFRTHDKRELHPLSSPKLNLILQQQIAGPIVFRVDSRFSLNGTQKPLAPCHEDTVYSLNYSLRFLESGKVVAWYSPKRKEGMVELRLFEF